MTQQSPFFLTKVECPICKTTNEFECIKVGAYMEHDHDTDFCPVGREWQNPQYEIFNPLLFFMATCDHCFYTREFKQSFKEWKNDTHFRTYQLKRAQTMHLQALAEPVSPARILGEARDPQRAPFATAVCKFLLGIYDELLLERPRKLDLGRFFLRIGWLFREHYGKPEQLIDHTPYFARDIEKAFIKLKHSQETFAANLGSIANLIEEQHAQRPERFRGDEFAAIYGDFQESLTGIKSLHSHLNDLLTSFGIQVQQNRQLAGQNPLPVQAGAVPFGGFPSFEDFLTELKQKWELVPLSEEESLLQAIEFYREALEGGHEIQPGNQQIQATYLIAELSRRVGRHSDAKRYFNNSIKLAQQFIFDNRGDKTRTALARRILELAVEQGKLNLTAIPG